MNKHNSYDLKQMQSLPLSAKVVMTKQRIIDWYEFWDGKVYVSFSGGKDSTVLLHLVRSIYPDVEAVFVDTGLEYPEIKQFVKSVDNVTILRPEKTFKQVIEEYGYPVVSKEISECVEQARKSIALNGKKYAYRLKRINGETMTKDGKKSQYNMDKWRFLLDSPFKISPKCCDVMKKEVGSVYQKNTGKKPYLGMLAEESRLRKTKWNKEGCNAFYSRKPQSNPLSFWTENDILQYLFENKIQYCPIYGEIVPDGEMDGQTYMFITPKFKLTGVERTGCMFCMFGAHLEKEPNRFQRMRVTHPNIYEYCMKPKEEGGLGLEEVLDYIGVNYE